MDNKEIVKEFAKKKFIEGSEGYELVIMLLSLAKQDKLDSKDILDIITYVFDSNASGIINSLVKAQSIASDEMLDTIVASII